MEKEKKKSKERRVHARAREKESETLLLEERVERARPRRPDKSRALGRESEVNILYPGITISHARRVSSSLGET